jgi:DNA-binding CsgD family transcriptional regulator
MSRTWECQCGCSASNRPCPAPRYARLTHSYGASVRRLHFQGLPRRPARLQIDKSLFTRESLGTKTWYEVLADVFSATSASRGAAALAEALVDQLIIDSTLLIHFPRGEGPVLTFGRFDSSKRSGSVDDYFRGHYVLDPFYRRLEECLQRGLMSLRDVIEENFDQSDYYLVHYRSAGLIDELCYCFSDRKSGSVLLSLSRAVGNRPFSDAEIEAARTIAPLVVGIMEASWRALGTEHPLETEVRRITAEMHRRIETARSNFGRSILTPREFEILQLILRGNSTDLISRKLQISVETVRVHRKHLYHKLDIKSQAEVFSLFLDVVSASSLEPDGDPLRPYIDRLPKDGETAIS